ncbi:MAG: L-2-amino-thiazoline-4-carboxylic acid hydrolase [Oscillospiraceae bacterium]|nr:L-2-amino-thiazoline-4-carboxylic acid hydrolase [Oscillospiraceae bacterium]
MGESFESVSKKLSLQKYNQKIYKWLLERYGQQEGNEIWENIKRKYLEYLEESPDYGGKKNGHAEAIYGGILIFAFYVCLPDQPPIAELQDFVQRMFLGSFSILGKFFDLNRNLDMAIIDKVFRASGDRDRKDILQYPCGFRNVDVPYDRENHAARYSFTQCPNAEFAKKHGLLHVLPLLCNGDFFGIGELHGTLIRKGTCGNSTVCDYCVVGNRNPMSDQYEIVTDDRGFLVSRKKEKAYE